jgi:hypothetical protein
VKQEEVKTKSHPSERACMAYGESGANCLCEEVAKKECGCYEGDRNCNCEGEARRRVEMYKLLRQLLKVSVELTDVGRVVARFDASHYAFGAEGVELSEVDERIDKVRKALEESEDSSDKSQIREYGRLAEQLRDIEREWRGVSENCGDPDEEEGEDEQGVCIRCGVPDGTYDSFSPSACNCLD